MKKKSSSKSAFFNFRVLLLLCAAGAVLVLAALGALPGGAARPQQSAQDQNGGLALAQQPHTNNLSPPGYAQQRPSSSGFMLMEAPGSSGAAVTTDKPDYVPGHAGVLVLNGGLVRTEILNTETVEIDGTGWAANQGVALHIDTSNGVPRFDVTVMADADGNIDSEFAIQRDDVGVAFTLTATQGDVSAFTQFTGVAGAGTALNDGLEGFVMEPDTVTVACGLSSCTPPYPTPIPGCTPCRTPFNESEVLRGFRVSLASVCNASGTLQMFYNDEHALTLGISAVTVKTSGGSTTTPYTVSPLSTDPGCATPVSVGALYAPGSDQSGTDVSGRPIYPSLFITDVTANPNNPLAGDWQFGGTPIPPDAVFGTWKAATKLVDKTTNPPTITITEPSDPAANNWNLGPGCNGAIPDATPPGLTNQGYGAECRWDLSRLNLTPGHQYRFYFIVHDGDQNHTGGDVGQACQYFISSAPTIGGQGANTTIECPATPSFTAPTASDTCGNVSVVQDSDSTTAGSCAGSYSRTRTWHAVDDCGNTTASVAQTITVRDTTAPTIGQAGSNATIECPNTPSFTAPTASDTCSGATVVLDSDNTVAGNCAGAYTETRTWHAVDGCGNTSGTRTQAITVRDITPPTIGGQGSDATIQCPNSPSFTAPTASDTCDQGPQVVLDSDNTVAGSCAGAYTETKTWHAVDACGNTSNQVHQTITVRDITPPTIGGQGSDATIDCPASPSFTAPTASDTCGGASVVQDSDNTVPGNCAGNYTETKTWHAVDACGNTSGTVTQTVTVRDTTPPTIGGQGSDATIECPASPTFTTPTASDTCGGASVVQDSDNTVPGNCAGNYTETKTWHAVDACGNTSGTVHQTITVRDTTPPTIGGQGSDGTIQCPNSPVFTVPTASDTCGGASVVQDSDNTVPGNCAGTYAETKTWHAVDACGNTSGQVHQTITVVDTTPPTIGSPGAAATIECPASPTFTAPTASDTCDPSAHVVLDSDNTTPGCGNTYTETRTWHAVDCSGNTSGQVSQTITVVDTTPPTIGGQGANYTTIICDSGPNFTAPTASDACGTATVQPLSDSTTTQGENTIYTRSWNAVDACGNTSATVSQIITSPFCCPNPLSSCTAPYPTPIPGCTLCNTPFNESEVLRRFTVSVNGDFCNPGGTLNMWYNDEHAMTLGVSQVNVITCLGTTTTYPAFSAGPASTPTNVLNPNVGATVAQGATDTAGRPMFPSLYITDLDVPPGNTNPLAGDWQFGGTPIKPDAVFGTWKGAILTINKTTTPATTTVSPGVDPPTNNWNLGGVGPAGTPDPVPTPTPTNQGYGAECRWNIDSLGLIPGHHYRFYFIVHDGDQNHTGGDVGQACQFFAMSVHAPTPSPTPPAPTPTPTPTATPGQVVAGSKAFSGKTVTVKVENDTASPQVLTGLALTWPQVPNGNLTKVTFNGTTVYQTSTANPPGLNTTSLLGTATQRTIAAGGSCGTLVFSFASNVSTNASNYTGSARFNLYGAVNF